MAAVVRSRSSWFARSNDTFCFLIVSEASCSFRVEPRVCEMYASCVLRISSSGSAKTTSA